MKFLIAISSNLLTFHRVPLIHSGTFEGIEMSRYFSCSVRSIGSISAVFPFNQESFNSDNAALFGFRFYIAIR
jgi:hypothetical protein